MTLKVIHRLQAFSDAIHRTFENLYSPEIHPAANNMRENREILN